jgi:hypothetical protein
MYKQARSPLRTNKKMQHAYMRSSNNVATYILRQASDDADRCTLVAAETALATMLSPALTSCSSTGATPGGSGAARCMSRQHQLLLSHRHTQPAASMDSKQLLPLPSADTGVRYCYTYLRLMLFLQETGRLASLATASVVFRGTCSHMHST